MLTEVDLAAVIALHRERKAKATIVLTPVENPAAYGLVETDAAGNVRRFLEKPKPDEITCDTINAGIYILEPDTFDRIPKDEPWSIERSFFRRSSNAVKRLSPTSTVATGSTSARRKYVRCTATSWTAGSAGRTTAMRHRIISPEARVEDGASSKVPASSTKARGVKPGARIGPYSVLGRQCYVEEHALVDGSIIWPNTRIAQEATVRQSIVGRHCHIGRNVAIEPGAVLGDKTVITDYSHVTMETQNGQTQNAN